MGPELTPDMLRHAWVIPVWGLLSTALAHLLGWMGKRALKLPSWTVVAAGRPNSSALPLLLLEALANTGVLDTLKRPGESTPTTLSRAKSLILLNVVVQQVFTFAVGPSILTHDQSQSNSKPRSDSDVLLPGPGGYTLSQDEERVGLLDDVEGGTEDEEAVSRLAHDAHVAVGKITDVPDIHWPERLAFLRKPLRKLVSFLNPPVIGGLIALVLGMIQPLHHAFLSKDGTFYNSLTSSVENLGKLFVSLQMFTVGAQLYIAPHAKPGIKPASFALLIRFLIMPAISICMVWATANRGIYPNDPLIWFLLILIPSGPSAMVLANLAEYVDVDQGPIAGYLIVSYIFSPLVAVTCTVGLMVVHK
jgi:predicted permease